MLTRPMYGEVERVSRIRILLAVFLVISAVVLSPLSSGGAWSPAHETRAAPAPSTSPSDSATVEDPAVVSLASDREIPVAQARSQMEAQVSAGRAEKNLPQELADVYAGRQMFHDKGGLVVVAVTDPSSADAMREHFLKFGVPAVEVQVSSTPQSEMQRLIDNTQERLRGSRAEPLVTVGMSTLGRITVTVAVGQLNATESDIVADATAAPNLYRIEEVQNLTNAKEQACDFTDDIECDPPLRGSVRFYSPQVCTVGFNVRSRIDSKPYVLTAGHCDIGDQTWKTFFEDGSSHDVGKMWNSHNDSVTDVGIITVNKPAGWIFGWPLVTVDPTGGEAANENYVIEAVLNPALGDRVCFTGGQSARTDCGYVDDTYFTGGGTDGLFHVDDLCARGGDSGAPYFAYGVAYGIHSAGWETGCYGGAAEEVFEAEKTMNVYILTA